MQGAVNLELLNWKKSKNFKYLVRGKSTLNIVLFQNKVFLLEDLT